MKLVYEDLSLKESQQSFRFFKVEEAELYPFWHYHPELELTLIYEGSGTRFIGDSILPYQPMDLVLVGENLPHHWVSVNSITYNPQKAIVIQFPRDVFAHFPECSAFQKLFDLSEKGIHFLNPSLELVEHLISFDESSKIQQLIKLMDILFQLLEHQNRSFLSTSSYKNQLGSLESQDKISKTTTYLLENLDQKLTLDHMADFTHLVPQSFCRWFKKATGNTFVNYLNKARIERACQLLLNTKVPISSICFEVGFDSLSHFNKTFLKMKHMSPREFRKSSERISAVNI